MAGKALYDNVEVLWKDRKRWCGLPWSFTRYKLIKKPGNWIKIISDIGFFHSEFEEINLFRIEDIKVYQSFSNKFWGTGTITIYSKDKSTPQFDLIRVKDPYRVRNILVQYLEEDRSARNMTISEAHI